MEGPWGGKTLVGFLFGEIFKFPKAFNTSSSVKCTNTFQQRIALYFSFILFSNMFNLIGFKFFSFSSFIKSSAMSLVVISYPSSFMYLAISPSAEPISNILPFMLFRFSFMNL